MGLWDSLGFGRKEAGGDAPSPARGSAPASTPGPSGAPSAARTGAPAWAPRIDGELCRACGSCIDECPAGVFSIGRHDTGARVARPEDCVASCDRCATHCPEKGITFPGR